MKYVALLRGINVGGKNSINMAKLKDCCEKIGFKGVSTYINSGNILFADYKHRQSELAKIIETCILDNFGLEISATIRSQTEIAEIARQIPALWVNDKHTRTDVLFLWQNVDRPSILDEIKYNPEVDNLLYLPGTIVWNFSRLDYSKSKLRNIIGTEFYKQTTLRNVNTVRRLNSLLADDAPTFRP